MPIDRLPDHPASETELGRRVFEQEARKLRTRKRTVEGIWFGMGMMGLVGWSVAIPTLTGTALGMWVDRHYPGSHSWTLALLVAGLCIGCANAWHWVSKENTAITEDQLEEPGEQHE
jgi:ATP synthase protein I